MIETVRNAWKIKELRAKILFTIVALIVFRFGHSIYVPYVDTDLLATTFAAYSSTILGYFNVLAGGGLATASVFALSVYPAINASIIMQLLQVAIPALERLAKDGGEEGRKKLAEITRYVTVAIATIMGCFQNSDAVGKIQQGSAWWFNDHKPGMIEQMTSLASLGLLGNFIGMLTDSRSFLSYTRHEYFRRIACELIGGWVENGEYPADYKVLEKIIKGISYNNTKRYFGFDV